MCGSNGIISNVMTEFYVRGRGLGQGSHSIVDMLPGGADEDPGKRDRATRRIEFPAAAISGLHCVDLARRGSTHACCRGKINREFMTALFHVGAVAKAG